MNDDRTEHKLVVLFADVSGSTRLYEQFGDDIARADVALCLSLLTEVAQRHGGSLLKTIGDEVMCSFPVPQRAVNAAVDMHETLRSASTDSRFVSGGLRVKVGCHYGVAEWRGEELVGAVPTIGQQVIGLAKAEEILASGQVIKALPEVLRADAQLIDTVESRVDGGDLEIFKVPWEESEDVTTFQAAPLVPPKTHNSLVITHGTKEFRVDAEHRHCSIGRIAGNDIVTGSRFSSRQHANIEYRHGRFHLQDSSINGTIVAPSDGQAVHLHREEGVLDGEGMLFFGNTNASDTGATARYRCE